MPQHWSRPARAPSSCQASSTWRSTPIPRAPDNPNQRTLRSADYNGPWLIYIALSFPKICMCVRVRVRACAHNRRRNRKRTFERERAFVYILWDRAQLLTVRFVSATWSFFLPCPIVFVLVTEEVTVHAVEHTILTLILCLTIVMVLTQQSSKHIFVCNSSSGKASPQV